jgi:hypothetical protein
VHGTCCSSLNRQYKTIFIMDNFGLVPFEPQRISVRFRIIKTVSPNFNRGFLIRLKLNFWYLNYIWLEWFEFVYCWQFGRMFIDFRSFLVNGSRFRNCDIVAVRFCFRTYYVESMFWLLRYICDILSTFRMKLPVRIVKRRNRIHRH